MEVLLLDSEESRLGGGASAVMRRSRDGAEKKRMRRCR